MVEDHPPSLDDFSRRLERLKADVAPAGPVRSGDEATSGLGMAFAMASHLVAGVGVGAFLGYLLDGWFGTAPALLIVLLFLGAAGGMLNVYRMATRQGMALGYRPMSSGSVDPGRVTVGAGVNETRAGGAATGDVGTRSDCEGASVTGPGQGGTDPPGNSRSG